MNEQENTTHVLVPKIYAASKTKHADKWVKLREEGYNIISTWIDEAGEGESDNLKDLQQRCINESKECDFMIVYKENDDYLKGAFIEMGIALSVNKRIYLWGEVLPPNNAFALNDNIFFVETFEAAYKHFINNPHINPTAQLQYIKELEDALKWLDIKIRERFHRDYDKAYGCMSNDTKEWIDKIQQALNNKTP